MTQKTYASRLATFIIMEILPRVKKAKTSPENLYPPVYTNLLVIAEKNGLLYRHQTRQYLDYILADYLGNPNPPNDTVLRVVAVVMSLIKQMVEEYDD